MIVKDMKPRIGIPAPTTIDLPYNQRSWPAYAAGVARAGGDPVEIPLTLPPSELEALAATCNGFLLPGSPADVNPTLYDTPRIEACGPRDAAREQTDFALLAHAAATGKPLLGICYGCQSMNVFHGGSLIQDLSPLPVNHAAGGSVAIAHSVLIPTGSHLATILISDPETTAELGAPSVTVSTSRAGGHEAPRTLRLPVNTSHHQSVAVCGQGLRIVARCPDDEVVEAIELASTTPVEPMFHVEHPNRFLLGVQWHPERSLDISPSSRALFHALITAATNH
jgi:putative glutamine amidotransferase